MSGKQKIDFEKTSAELAAKEGPILVTIRNAFRTNVPEVGGQQKNQS